MAERGYDAYYPLTAPVPVALTHASDFYDNGAIRTLFIAGLPDDVKAREIHNLFRRRPGFDSCQLKYTGRGNQVVAFRSGRFCPLLASFSELKFGFATC